MNKKIAVINPNLNLLYISIVQTIDDINLNDIYKVDFQKKYSNIKEYLQNAVTQLYEKQFINQKSVVISYLSNLSPIAVTFSADCEFNMLNLKQLQTNLLDNDFNLKIIL